MASFIYSFLHSCVLHCMDAFSRSRGQPRRDDKLRGRILANDGIGVAEPDALETPSAPSLETFSQTKVLPVFGCMGLGPLQPKTGNTLRILSLEYLRKMFYIELLSADLAASKAEETRRCPSFERDCIQEMLTFPGEASCGKLRVVENDPQHRFRLQRLCTFLDLEMHFSPRKSTDFHGLGVARSERAVPNWDRESRCEGAWYLCEN